MDREASLHNSNCQMAIFINDLRSCWTFKLQTWARWSKTGWANKLDYWL